MARRVLLAVLVAAGCAVPCCVVPCCALRGASAAGTGGVEAPLPDAPLPTLYGVADAGTMLQFGGGPGSVGSNRVGERGVPAGSSGDVDLLPFGTPVLQPCIPNVSTSVMVTMSCESTNPLFQHYLKSSLVVPLTPRDKFILATKDIFDPFNLLTILADATYGVESDAHGVYGPGVNGIAKYSGVSFTEDMAGEYFGTFMVCSLARQDPHYHREPYRSLRHRILHAFVQIVWTQGDTGKPMFNYANIVGGIATAAVSNTFVPGPGRQGWGNTSQRLALAFATSPSGNLITEFVPDIASHINFHVVIFQRILNTVSNEEGGGPP
ncbi:MAG TPA: hypothetical protein VMU62_03030 [Acidobacteriaceae bacterium]|nr:hypothetical protein [Acidobacteriaceae bacterium]